MVKHEMVNDERRREWFEKLEKLKRELAESADKYIQERRRFVAKCKKLSITRALN